MPQTSPCPTTCAGKLLREKTALLRDAHTGTWRLLTDVQQVVFTTRIEEVASCLRKIEQRVAEEGLFAAGFVAYEAAPAFDAALATHLGHDFPLLWFGLYRHCSEVTLSEPEGKMPELAWEPTINQAEYQRCLERIHGFIRAGDTYQVNFSYRLSAPHAGRAWPLFTHLANSHSPEYGAYLNLGRWEILSLSPELFFQQAGGRLTSIPMKGTIGRGLGSIDDRAQGKWLRNSSKNRAENVMIVDMVRNDLGRIALPGTVQVDELFALRRYPSLWQMTSTVSAQVNTSLADIFAALFPAASITGAPKARTMALIKALETSPRRIYTGAIGFLLPDGRAQFNVAIRTLLHDRDRGLLEYGVGGGIVADSSSAGEWEETRVKALACRPPFPAFSLLETLRWTPAEGVYLLDAHLHRLGTSAEYFSYPCDEKAILQLLDETVAEISLPGCKLRLLLDCHGRVRLETAPLPNVVGNRHLRLAPARHPVDQTNPLLYHKTTLRRIYEQARADAPPDVDDVLLYNQRGEITETTMANIVVTLEGRRYTPPVCCGLLPGTMRQHLLARGEIEERPLPLDCLKRAEAITLINSVRGSMSARMVEAGRS